MHHKPLINDATIPHRVEVNLREVGQLFNTNDWWPLHRRGRIYEKLSRMRVEVRKQKG